MSSPTLSRLFLIFSLLSLSACFLEKPQSPPAHTVIKPSTKDEEDVGAQATQTRGRHHAIIEQLRKSPHLRVNETDAGTILAQMRSGNVFRTSGATINPQFQPTFAHIAATLAAYPWLQVRIIGHTDHIGDPQQNLTLSVYRAQSVRDALVALGVDAYKVTYEGRGDTDPLVSNSTEEGRAVNRRVDFLFTGTPPEQNH